MRVVWTEVAQADLQEIGDFIAVESPMRAASFLREPIAAGEAIGDMPRAFPLVPQLEHKRVRRRRCARYLTLYRTARDVMAILHVVHGARDHGRLLLGEDF